jgi:hypothetical protein
MDQKLCRFFTGERGLPGWKKRFSLKQGLTSLNQPF